MVELSGRVYEGSGSVVFLLMKGDYNLKHVNFFNFFLDNISTFSH